MTDNTVKEDWAKHGYFRVIDRRKIKRYDEKDNFNVNMMRANGLLAFATWHADETSMLQEVEAWLNRGAKPTGIEAFNAVAKVKQWQELRDKK